MKETEVKEGQWENQKGVARVRSHTKTSPQLSFKELVSIEKLLLQLHSAKRIVIDKIPLSDLKYAVTDETSFPLQEC